MNSPNAQTPAPNLLSDAPSLDAAADQAVAACGGDAREAVKAQLVVNGFLDAQISHGYLRGNLFQDCKGRDIVRIRLCSVG